MFSQIVLEVIEAVTATCNTEAQRRRILSAYSEGPLYSFEDVSHLYRQPAVRVTSTHSEYLCFPDQCGCPDWTKRGPILGTGEIVACKHILAAEFHGEFTCPEDPEPIIPEEVRAEETLRELVRARMAQDFADQSR